MEKRAIITAAGAITLTVLASSSALAVNFRGADNNSPGDVGTFTPKDTTTVAPQVATVYVDVPAAPTSLAPVAVTAAPSPAVTVSPAAGASRPVTTTQASSSGSDDGHKGESEQSHSEDGGGHGDD